jgi:hypothetical protein
MRALRPVGMPILLGAVLAFWPVALALWLALLPILAMKARRRRRWGQ